MSLEIAFTKMHGCGNDFVVLRNPGLAYDKWPELSRELCDRHFGIGSDGLMLLQDASSPESEVEVWMFNPDGSPMGMCGNGIRCLTRFLVLEKVINDPSFSVNFNVLGRKITCETEDFAQHVRVNMGEPSLEPEDLPALSEKPLINAELCVAARTFKCTCVSMGNPHCVIPLSSFEGIDVKELGSAFEHHQIFPERCNVEFVLPRLDNYLEVKVWERGAGLTLACGTGACASLVACMVLGLSKSPAIVKVPGGSLEIEWEGEGKPVFMKGPAKEVFSGIYKK